MTSRPKTPKRTLKRQKSGLLESVFTYVSQEVHAFVASATGAPDNEELENNEEDGEAEYGSEEEEGYEEHTQRLNDTTPPRKSRNKNTREEGTPSPPRKKPKSKPQRRSPSPEQLAFAASSSSSTTAKPPQPTRSILTRKPSQPTMPGSLIPFSPGSSAGGDDDDEDEKHVHFDGGSPETAVDLTATNEQDDELELTPRRPRARSPHTPTPSPTKRRDQATPNSAVRAAVQKFKPQSDSSMLLPQQQISPSKSRETASPMRVLDSTDKGKAPAKPYDRSFGSSESRAPPEPHDHTFTDEGSTDPELKIRKLEEEVKRLREELARQSVSVTSKRDTSNVSTTDFSFLAPAPPPPPPPPPPGTIFRVPNQSDNLDAVFTHVRAALRHKTPPKEKPINYAGPSGIACVGVAPDKMAAFLMEMKTVKLKKTADRERSFASEGDVSRLHSLATHAKRVGDREMGLQRDRSFASEGDVSLLDATFSLPRSRIGTDSNAGDKRKRLLDDHDRVAGELDRALKKRSVLSASTRSTASFGAGNSSGSRSFDSSMSSGQSQGQSQSQSHQRPSSTHTLVRDWRAGTAAANSRAGSSTTSSTAASATSADAPTPSLCSDGDAESQEDPPPSTPPPLTHEDPHNVSMSFRPPTPPLSRRSVDILPAEVHYEISLRAPQSETPVALRGDVSVMVGDDDDGEEDMREETPMPAAISINGLEKTAFEKRAPASPLPEKSPRRPRPPASRANLGRSRGQATPMARTPVNTNGAQPTSRSNKTTRSAKGTPHPMKTVSGGSLPRRVVARDEEEDDELAIRPAETYADQTFNFDDSSANLSMSILSNRGGPRRVPMRQALPRTDPAVAAAARRLALAHSIGRSSRRSDSDRTASPPAEANGMEDATFTLDDLRTERERPQVNAYIEVDEQTDVTMRRTTPRKSSPAKTTPTRTMRRRRSTLDQELRRSSIASSIAISATGNASFSMLTGEELPPGMLDDDDDDTVDFLKRMGEGEGGRYDFEGEDEFGDLEDEHMYVGLGTRPKTGFLVHGGAGGPAVWTDV